MWLLKKLLIAIYFIGCLAALVAMASIHDKVEQKRCVTALNIVTTGHDTVVYIATNPRCIHYLEEYNHE